ncbi:MAG: response regulator [Candidatus Omnitrophota bacterium]
MNKKILIINDQEDNYEPLKSILEDFYPLILTRTAEAGLDVLKNSGRNIAVIFIEGNDTELLDEIKKHYPDSPVIITAGHNFEETAKALNNGAADYILKPFKSEDVLKAVKTYFIEEKNDT